MRPACLFLLVDAIRRAIVCAALISASGVQRSKVLNTGAGIVRNPDREKSRKHGPPASYHSRAGVGGMLRIKLRRLAIRHACLVRRVQRGPPPAQLRSGLWTSTWLRTTWLGRLNPSRPMCPNLRGNRKTRLRECRPQYSLQGLPC
jgi:hypothetical protein